MRKILVTGGSGFLGGHLLKNLSPKRWQIHAACWRHVYDTPKVQWHPYDLSVRDEVKQLFKTCAPEVVIHTAAKTSVDACQKNPALAEQINVDATRHIAGLCRDNNCRLVHLSTDMIFDGEKGRYSEEDEPNPIHVYGKTKLQAEKVVAETNGDYAIVRTALTYGMPHIGGTTFSAWMVEQWKKGETVSLFEDEYRTPISATNITKILIELADHPFRGIIHCGGKDSLSRYDFGVRVANSLGISEEYIQACKTRDVVTDIPRPRDLSLDSTNLLLTIKTSLLSTQEGINLEFVGLPRRKKR